MDLIYSSPLHGVACKPFCESNSTKLAVDVNFQQVDVEHANSKTIWTLHEQGERYTTHLEIAQLISHGDANVIEINTAVKNFDYLLKVNCEGSGVFRIQPSNITIDWNRTGTGSAHYFQSLAITLWLELQGVLCVHANALQYGNRVCALMAPSRTGKTTLTLAMLKQGFNVLTDDMVALHQSGHNEYVLYPSWPMLRLWPDSVKNVLNVNPNSLEKVHERFEKRVVKLESDCNHSAHNLNTIYLLNRVKRFNTINETNSVCNIADVSAAQAIIILLQNSMLAGAYKSLGIEATRFVALSNLLKNVSFKQVNYLSGTEYLASVSQCIKDDLTKSS